MKVIFDASSLLNMAHGDVLETMVLLHEGQGIVGPQVYGECQSIRAELDALISGGALTLATDANLPASIYFDVLGRFGLGAGETECISFAKCDPTIEAVCCDDRAARTACASELGRPRVTGTLAQLARAVRGSALTGDDAYTAYQRMLTAGGFLPNVTRDQFDELVRSSA